MKQIKTKILCLLLSALMVLGLAACGKEKTPKDSSLIEIGEYQLLYKGACIMEDMDGNDAIVLTLDFQNNSKETVSYLWSISETAVQNGTDLLTALIYVDEDFSQMVTDGQMTEAAPGETVEIKSAFVLEDTVSEVEVRFGEFLGSKGGEITIDPSTLSRETAGAGGTQSDDGGKTLPTGTGNELLDWWNGEWYGWWIMSGCYGAYEELEGQWWDICGIIDIKEDYTGTVTLWDEEYTASNSMVSAAVSLSEAGTGEHGAMMSEGGYFTDMPLEHADWIVDPGVQEDTEMIWINGSYENGDDEYSYDIYLRRWGDSWDHVEEDARPRFYDSWYLPMIEAGEAMPDSIAADLLADGGNAEASISASDGDVPGGDGIVTDEAVQKGYVWMSKVAKDIFHMTYEELVDYFGVEGEFVKEEYSDHMKANYRYYKWISSENPHNFIYVNFQEKEPDVYVISAYNTSGFSGSEAIDKYLDELKAEAAEQDKDAAANTAMKDFSMEVNQFAQDDVKVKITTTIPESGWSHKKDTIVENDDPDAFGAGAIRFKLRESLEKLDSNKDSYKNFAEIDSRIIGGITFQGRTYEYIGYEWIEYVAQIDDTRALSIGLTDLDCVPGTIPDIILSNMQFQ